jgi:hypothetical protein
VLSYDRQAKVLNKSVAAFLAEYEAANNDIFSEPDPQPKIPPIYSIASYISNISTTTNNNESSKS